MLRKNEPLDIDPDQPFKWDRLGRLESAENLTALVAGCSQPFVLSVSGPWGSGKTTFVQMWKRHLEIEGHSCLYFNAWENDYVDDPLIAMIGEIQENIDRWALDFSKHPKANKSWKTARSIGAGILRKATPLAVRLATHGLLEMKEIKDAFGSLEPGGAVADFAASLASERLESYAAEKKGITRFREQLASFAADVAEGEDHKAPLIFFVDELDRCRPLFAVELLERIKHLFSVPGIVFVLSIAREELIHSIRALYGAGMDADGYLRRFIDLDYRLPTPRPEEYAENLFDQLDLEESLRKRRNGQSERQGILEIFAACVEMFAFSLRAQEQCFTLLGIALRTTHSNHTLFEQPLTFLIALRQAKPALYTRFAEGVCGVNDLFAELRRLPGGDAFLKSDVSAHLEVYLTVWTQIEEQVAQQFQSWKSRESDGTLDEKERSRAEICIRFFSYVRIIERQTSVEPIRRKIEFTGRFDYIQANFEN